MLGLPLSPLHGWGLNMPLVKSASKEAFRKNVKTEVATGKPLKQSLAIAYSTQREAASKTSAKSTPKGKK